MWFSQLSSMAQFRVTAHCQEASFQQLWFSRLLYSAWCNPAESREFGDGWGAILFWVHWVYRPVRQSDTKVLDQDVILLGISSTPVSIVISLMVVKWIDLPNKEVLTKTTTMTLPTGDNDKAAAGDRESNKLMNTSCAEEACWNPGGQWGTLGRLKEVNELIGLGPGSWQNKINTSNYQVRRVEEGSKLIACVEL